jgi:two-component system LytT family response regulator
MLKAVIVDDEELARQVLREYLAPHEGITVVAECANGFEAVKAVAEHKPDLLLLDIQMPKLDGFEVLELIEEPPAIVFVTAYDTYAMRDFDVHAVDYLLKPFTSERFDAALGRVLQRLGQKGPAAGALAAAARASDHYAERLVVKDGARVHVIPVDRLDYAEAQDDYVALHSEGRQFLKQQTIADLESALDPRRFVRIHRSYVINLERVDRIEPYSKDSRVAILTTGAKLPISRTGYAKLREVLGEE